MTKILVVEDDFFLRDGLSELLTKEGYEPVTAQNAAEAQARLAGDKFSLIILDVMLPDGLISARRFAAEAAAHPCSF